MEVTVQLLRNYMHEIGLDRPEQFGQSLFRNGRGERLSRSGVRYILQKYVMKARGTCPSLSQDVSPHTFRHTKGMHLLQSEVPLVIVRDFLGHGDLKTTQIYARANIEMKRAALEKVGDSSPVAELPSWQLDKDLLQWLKAL